MALRKMWAVGEATDCSSTKQDKAVGRRDAGLRTVCVAADRSSVPGQNPVLQRHSDRLPAAPGSISLILGGRERAAKLYLPTGAA
eukprot:scaffold78309_cov19-Tisochrysis_lutea.AAC.1